MLQQLSIDYNLLKGISYHYSKSVMKSTDASTNFVKRNITIGDFIMLSYSFFDNKKKYCHIYEGIIIRRKTHNLGQYFTLKQMFKSISVEYGFLANSPSILFLKRKYSYKIRQANLFFLRYLSKKNRFSSRIIYKKVT